MGRGLWQTSGGDGGEGGLATVGQEVVGGSVGAMVVIVMVAGSRCEENEFV